MNTSGNASPLPVVKQRMRCQNCGTGQGVQQHHFSIGLPVVALCDLCLTYLTPSGRAKVDHR